MRIAFLMILLIAGCRPAAPAPIEFSIEGIAIGDRMGALEESGFNEEKPGIWKKSAELQACEVEVTARIHNGKVYSIMGKGEPAVELKQAIISRFGQPNSRGEWKTTKGNWLSLHGATFTISSQ